MRHADAAVVGGGPAGAAVAWRLATAGARVVLVHDRRDRWGPVGQQLPAGARPVLAELGVLDAVAAGALAVHEARSVWGGPGVDRRPALFDPYGAPLAVDRPHLDRLLRQAAERAGARVFDGRVRAVPAAGGGWQVEDAAGRRRWTTRILVDASGASRACSRGHLPWTTVDRLRCVLWRVRPAGPAPQPYSLVEADPDGWWYTCPTASGDLLTVMRAEDMPAATAAGRPRAHEASLRLASGRPPRPPPRTRDRLGVALPAERAYRVAVIGYADPPWAPSLVAVGDAAFAADPLSASGLGSALYLAAPAADAVLGLLDGDPRPAEAYAEDVRARVARHLEQRGLFLRLPAEYAEAPFWARRGARHAGMHV